MSSKLDVSALIAGRQIDDPRLYQCIMRINDRIGEVEDMLFPILRIAEEVAASAAALAPPVSFSSSFTPTTVRFNWTQVIGASQYEIRKGELWDTAAFQLRSSSFQADIDPLLVGSHTYLIKALSSDGEYSTDSTSTVVTVPAVGLVTINSQVIDNNVLLGWLEPTTVFRILHYEISKDGDVVGTVSATFFTRFETIAATYTYAVVAVDMAGNRSAPAEVAVTVLQPPDYALQDTRVSALGGTRVNVILQSGPSLLANWVAETFEVHFTSRAWLSPQAQVTAGYPIYIQPANLTGSYEEVINYGVVLNNVIATITFNTNLITPAESMTVVVKMATSTDGISYSAFTSGSSQFLTTLQYLKFRLEFTGSTDKALMEISEVTINLDVKRENDGGEVSALSSDVGGTPVTFNKAFKDVESLTATVKSTTEPFIVIIDFVDIPSPTGFNVYVFDTTGNRVSKTVEWKARGII